MNPFFSCQSSYFRDPVRSNVSVVIVAEQVGYDGVNKPFWQKDNQISDQEDVGIFIFLNLNLMQFKLSLSLLTYIVLFRLLD